jgi:hypothetical protein
MLIEQSTPWLREVLETMPNAVSAEWSPLEYMPNENAVLLTLKNEYGSSYGVFRESDLANQRVFAQPFNRVARGLTRLSIEAISKHMRDAVAVNEG